MPSVGGIRRTRVFGLVKSVDGARVLRSGRQLWPEPGEGKPRKAGGLDRDEWLAKNVNAKNSKSYPNNGGILKGKENGWAHEAKTKQEARPDIKLPELPKRVLRSTTRNLVDKERRMFGAVYTRKRKRVADGLERQELLGAKKFGIQLSQRQRRNAGGFGGFERCLCLIVESSSSGSAFGRLLLSVLMYMKRVGLRLSVLTAFLLSEPIRNAFDSGGILFSWDPLMENGGVCRLFGMFQFVPLFSVNFSAIPSCFMYMHLSLVFGVKYLSFGPVNNLLDEDDDFLCGSKVDSSCVLIKSKTSGKKITLDEAASPGKKAVHSSVIASKLVGRNYQLRSSLNSRGIRKRRSSIRQRRARNTSLVSLQKSSSIIVVGLACTVKKVDSLPSVISKKNVASLPSAISENMCQSSVITRLAAKLKKSSSTAVQLVQDTSSNLSRCFANLLVIGADQCYRLEGVSIILEISDSREWVLFVKKDGRTLYHYLAQNVMRPCTFNRITHDVIWSADETWKLEFPSRQDWSVFKDLYKECYDHNVPAVVTRVIPVPGVHEVLDGEDSTSASFSRTDTYIIVTADEVARALAKKSPNYDIDSEDEEWLKNFNNKSFMKNQHYESLSEDKFELLIDTFEKAIYCSPDDFADEKALDFCGELGRKEVVEAVYGYWMKKRERKRSALLKVFQVHQPKRAPVIPTAVLRKKRSFKRQPSQFGRGKQPSLLLQAMAAEQALEEQNAMLKVEETKEFARSSGESAIAKRKRAQLLMENADLAIYRAVTALRIAEATCFTDVADVPVTHFID